MSKKSESAVVAETSEFAPSKPPEAPKPVAVELMTPEQHAKATDNVKLVTFPVAFGGKRNKRALFSVKHSAAAMMHGWGRYDSNNAPESWGHLHHTGVPMVLSRADYLAALEAAGNGDVPHAAALSPFKNFKSKPKDRSSR